MPVSLTFHTETLYAFLLVLARVAGAISFVPLPGFNASSGPARTVFVLSLALALYPVWPRLSGTAVTPGLLMVWAAAEAVTGIAIGITVAILLEAFVLAGQVIGLQAGYAYAQTIDPNTQADSGILLVFAQLMAGMCFFALGLDRDVIRVFAETLVRIPPGSYGLSGHAVEPVIRLAGMIFSVGVRLALPVVGLLVLVDMTLALLGRINAQLQLIQMAFPAKMLAALLVMSWIAALFPIVLREFAGVALGASRRILGL